MLFLVVLANVFNNEKLKNPYVVPLWIYIEHTTLKKYNIIEQRKS